MKPIEAVDTRPIAIISTQGDRTKQPWIRDWFTACFLTGGIDIIDPEITEPRVFKERLIAGAYRAVVMDTRGVDYYENVLTPWRPVSGTYINTGMKLHGEDYWRWVPETVKKIPLVYMVDRPYRPDDELIALVLGVDRTFVF